MILEAARLGPGPGRRALLGAIALLGRRGHDHQRAWRAFDVPTMAHLFALMVISAQFRLGGFYARVTRKLARPGAPRPGSCFWSSWPPPCSRRSWPTTSSSWPWPRSWWRHAGAATSTPCPTSWDWPAPRHRVGGHAHRQSPEHAHRPGLGHPLRWYFLQPRSGGGRTRACWAVIALLWRGRWRMEAPRLRVRGRISIPGSRLRLRDTGFSGRCFPGGSWPREVAALFLRRGVLSSRRLTSARFFSLVDWPLLLLFMAFSWSTTPWPHRGFWPACTACSNRAGWTEKRDVARTGTVVLSTSCQCPGVMLLSARESSQGPP
jgi:hypothetical protein